MSSSVSINSMHTRKHQRGEILIEAMIALLIMAIMSLSLTLLTTKTLAEQRQLSTRNIAVTQLRDLLQRNGDSQISLCSKIHHIKLPGDAGELPISVEGCEPVTIKISGYALDGVHLPLRLVIDSPIIGGKIEVGAGS